MQDTAEGLTVREYARKEGITIQAVYRRLWEGRVKGKQFLGRWLVCPDSTEPIESKVEIEMTA